jgi:hypothetical protein
MKLVINFGHNGIKKEVDWYRQLMDFPKLIRFSGSKWEWAMYHNVGSTYELTFSQIATYDPNYYVDMPSFEDMFEWGVTDKCVCGAIYSSFQWDHLRYCPKHKPWSQI